MGSICLKPVKKLKYGKKGLKTCCVLLKADFLDCCVVDDDEYEHFDMFSGGKLCHEKNRILKIKIWETFLNSKNWVIIVSIFLLMVISLGIIVSSHHQLSPRYIPGVLGF